MRHLFQTSILLICLITRSQAQDTSGVVNKIANFPGGLYSSIIGKTTSLNRRIDKQTQKYLRELQTQDAKLRSAFYRVDSNAARNLYWSNPEARYQQFLQQTGKDSLPANQKMIGSYLPYADSLQGSLAFLKQNPQLVAGGSASQAAAAFGQVQQLEARLNNDELIRQFIIERRDQIRQFLSQQAVVPQELQSIYANYNKQLYYYSQQISQYREMLNDPDKMVKTALNLLEKIPAFGSFMQQHSFLSGLIATPADYNMANSLAGMQTRDAVNQMIQAQVSSGGPNAASALSQGLQSAQSQLDQLKSKLGSLGPGGKDADLPPNFQPNTQKTKTFWQRLQYGFDVQSATGSSWFPVTTDLGLSMGYKLNDKSIIGVGVSYKLGWGQNISHISLSNQGLGLRSFLDWKIKGSFYATGGLEYNYQQPFGKFAILYHLSSWQQSGLIGITKTVSVRSKWVSQTKLQLLWDFLSYSQIPQAQPFKFRVGYNF